MKKKTSPTNEGVSPQAASAHKSDMDTTYEELTPMLTMDDLCEYTQISKSTLYSLRSAGRGPMGFLIGRCLRFRMADVNVWLHSLRDDIEAA